MRSWGNSPAKALGHLGKGASNSECVGNTGLRQEREAKPCGEPWGQARVLRLDSRSYCSPQARETLGHFIRRSRCAPEVSALPWSLLAPSNFLLHLQAGATLPKANHTPHFQGLGGQVQI